jgi:hypothetical protein
MTQFVNDARAVLSQSSNFQRHLNELRDHLRDLLSQVDAARYPRFGPNTIGVFEPLSEIIGPTSLEAIGQLICVTCHAPRIQETHALNHDATSTNLRLAFDLRSDARPIPVSTRPTISFEDWLAAYWLNCFSPRTLERFSATVPCSSCSQQSLPSLVLRITHAPALFFVDVSCWDLETNPFHVLYLVMVDGTPITYRLSAAIYHGINHWTSRWISLNGHVWSHDGRKHHGTLQSDGKMTEPLGRSKFCSLRTSGSATLSILIYALDI